MATEKINVKVVVTAENNAKKGLLGLQSSVNSLNKDVSGLAKALGVGLVAAIGGVIAIGKKAIDTFKIQEQAEARLLATTKNVLTSFQGYKEGSKELDAELQRVNDTLKEQAQALQRVTTFGDEQIISAQSMLSTFALNERQVKKLVPAVLDMSAAMEKAGGTGADLESISIAIGKSLTTGVGALTRYGVVVSDTAREAFELADAEEKVNIILGELNKNFEGVAEQAALTASGKMQQLNNAFSDLQETVGGALAEALTPFVQQATIFAQDPRTQERVKQIATSFGEFATVTLPIVIDSIKILWGWLNNIVSVMIAVGDKILWVINKILDLIDAIKRLSKYDTGAFSRGFGVSRDNAPKLSFDTGGVVPGPIGAPQLAMVHGGETILPTHKGGFAGGTINVNFNNPTFIDEQMAEKVGDQFAKLLKRELRF